MKARVVRTPLLCLDFAVLFDVDVFVGLEDTDFVIRELDTIFTQSWSVSINASETVQRSLKRT